MAKIIQEPILTDLHASSHFAIMVDVTTDVEIVKELVVYLRDLEYATQFLIMIPLMWGTAESIIKAINSFFGWFGICQ